MPYWERTWIVQEILLAQNVFVISASGLFPWSAFTAFCMRSNMFEKIQVKEPTYLRSLCEWRKGDRPPHGQQLLRLLTNFSDTRCADVRDRVYGLLGLADDAKGLSVDYRRSTAMLLLDVLERETRQQVGNVTAPFSPAVQLQGALGVTVCAYCGRCTAQNIRGRADCAPACHKQLAIVGYVSAANQTAEGMTDGHYCFRCGHDLMDDWATHTDESSISLLRPTACELYFVSTKGKLLKHPKTTCGGRIPEGASSGPLGLNGLEKFLNAACGDQISLTRSAIKHQCLADHTYSGNNIQVIS